MGKLEMSVYDPTKLKVEIGGVTVTGFACEEKFNLYSYGNILASVTLQVTSDSVKQLMDFKGEFVDYCFNYKDSESFSEVSEDTNGFALAHLLWDKGWGTGRLEYEIIVGSNFPLIKFLIVKE